MNDSIIIYNFISASIPEDHPIIYLYVAGGPISKETAIGQGIKLMNVLSPPYEVDVEIKPVLTQYLNDMKTLHKNNKINVKPIY